LPELPKLPKLLVFGSRGRELRRQTSCQLLNCQLPVATVDCPVAKVAKVASFRLGREGSKRVASCQYNCQFIPLVYTPTGKAPVSKLGLLLHTNWARNFSF